MIFVCCLCCWCCLVKLNVIINVSSRQSQKCQVITKYGFYFLVEKCRYKCDWLLKMCILKSLRIDPSWHRGLFGTFSITHAKRVLCVPMRHVVLLQPCDPTGQSVLFPLFPPEDNSCERALETKTLSGCQPPIVPKCIRLSSFCYSNCGWAWKSLRHRMVSLSVKCKRDLLEVCRVCLIASLAGVMLLPSHILKDPLFQMSWQDLV